MAEENEKQDSSQDSNISGPRPELQPPSDNAPNVTESKALSDMPDPVEPGTIRNQSTERPILERLIMSSRTKGEWPTDEIPIRMDGTEALVSIKALTNPVYNQANTASQKRPYRDKQTGRLIEDFDNDRFNREIMLHGVTDPPLDDKQLLEAYHVSTSLELLDKAFLPGEIAGLAQKILELSGFSTKEVASIRD